MDETHTRIDLAPELLLLPRARQRLDNRALVPGVARAIECEVVGRGYAVLDEVEAAVECVPIEVLRFRRLGVRTEIPDPVQQWAAGSEPAVGALPDMAVSGNEAGADKLAARINDVVGGQPRRRIAA